LFSWHYAKEKVVPRKAGGRWRDGYSTRVWSLVGKYGVAGQAQQRRADDSSVMYIILCARSPNRHPAYMRVPIKPARAPRSCSTPPPCVVKQHRKRRAARRQPSGTVRLCGVVVPVRLHYARRRREGRQAKRASSRQRSRPCEVTINRGVEPASLRLRPARHGLVFFR